MNKSCRTCKNNVPLSGCKLSDRYIRYCLGSGHMYHPHEYNLWEPLKFVAEENKYKQIAEEIANLVTEKQKAYGNSFGEAEAFLKLLYPDGIPVEKYKDMLALVRIWDKIKRIAADKDALGESPYNDIMGYCLLALNEIKQKGDKNEE